MDSDSKNVLRKIGNLQKELEYIKRDLMHIEEKSEKKTFTFWQC